MKHEKLCDLIRFCRVETGKKLKEERISDYLQSENFTDEMKIFQCLIDPDIVFNFSSAMIDSTDQNNSKNDYSLSQFLSELASGSLSGNNAKSTYSGLQLDDNERFILDVILRKTAVGFSLRSVNKIHEKLYGRPFVEKFECQLADKWNPSKKYKNGFWWMTPKLDGLRAVFHSDKGILLSRNNKEFKGFEAIESFLKAFCNEKGISHIDGELFNKSIPFQTIQSIATKEKHPRKDELLLNVFAIIGSDIVSDEVMNATMVKLEQEVRRYGLEDVIEVLVPKKVDNGDVVKTCQDFIEKGFEGIMLRNPDKHYNFGRSQDLLKVKLFTEDDFVVTGIFEGEGKYKGMLGGIYVENVKTKISRDAFNEIEAIPGSIKSRCGSGFSDEDRQTMSEDMIGKVVNIKYQGLTDDCSSLRFPIFLGVKEDR